MVSPSFRTVAMTEPDSGTRDALMEFARLVAIMQRLRGPDGCAWDRAQNFASIVQYTIEEAYEVAEAIARNDMDNLAEELGDLLLQVVFHAQMAAEAGFFELQDVVRAICEKMERRHPHVFGPAADQQCAEKLKANWETLKAAEKQRDSALDGIALALPALVRADKLAAGAARLGFDWPDAQGPLQKIHEELGELQAATTAAEREEEAGDLLFAVANYVRKQGIDPETALRFANGKFERRFRAMEKAPGFSGLSPEAMEALWQSAKKSIKANETAPAPAPSGEPSD